MKKIYYILLAGSLVFATYSCNQSAKQAEHSDAVHVGADPDAEHDLSETDGMTEEERIAYENSDAPDEGLSQTPYEDLEMPAEIKGQRETIVMKLQFALSYNLSTFCPNYVCWHLTENRINGNVKRSDNFIPDDVLAPSTQVVTRDYTNSGYDRGHMCPAGDNKNSQEAMQESFMMSNICPQKHELNDGDWKELEELCREWVGDYGDLYICCGPIFDSDSHKTIGNRKDVKISVPDRFFKVILRMGKTPRAIGFIFNNDGTRRDLRNYAVTIDKVEETTGIDFFPALDDNVEKKVESECKPADWNI